MVRLVKHAVITAVAMILVAGSVSSVEAQWGRTGLGVSGTGGYAAGGYNYGVTGGVRYRRYNRWSRRAYRRGYGSPSGYYVSGVNGSYGSAGSYGSVGYSYDVCVGCPTVNPCGSCGVIECGVMECGVSDCDSGVCSSGPVSTTVIANNDASPTSSIQPVSHSASKPLYAYDYQTPYREPVARRVDIDLDSTSKATGDNRLRLTLNVPVAAKIFVNGKPTTSTGAVRSYVTPPVEANRWYVFSIRAVIDRDGEQIEKTQEIRVEPNAPSILAFHFPVAPKSLEKPATQITKVAPEKAPSKVAASEPATPKSLEKPETLITVVAPDNARVLLAGVDTQSAGNVRVFKSRTLAAGQKWQDYHVTVQFEQNGKLVTRSAKIDVVAGKSHELTFAEDNVQVASR